MCKPILHCGRYRGNVFGLRFVLLRVARIHRGVECLQHDGAFFGWQPGVNGYVCPTDSSNFCGESGLS